MPILTLENKPFTAEDFINKLFPNFWSFLINFLALIVLFVLLYFIAYKPVKKYFNARKDHIAQNIEDSEKAKTEYETRLKTSEGIIEEANLEKGKILEKARLDGERRKEALEAEAKEEIALYRKQADQEILSSLDKARKQMHDEVVNLALDASKEALGKALDSATEKRLVASFESDLSEKTEK